MKKNTFALSLFLLFFISATAQESKYKKIDSLLTYLTHNHKFMGSVSLMEKGKPVFEKAYGYISIEPNIKATPATKYKIGSITKMFTATAIFKLIEDKKLTLDTKLSKYYPKIKNADKITISNLLNHSSGIFNFTNADGFLSMTKSPQTKKEMVNFMASFESDFEPGSKHEYSNSNYLLLGYIIEDITKKTYIEAVTDMVIKKAGLKNTSFYDTINTADNEANSYMYTKIWEKWDEWDQSVAYSAGGIQATTTDLDTFITALFNGKIINKQTLALMTTFDGGYGRGVFAIPFEDKQFMGHGGHIEGFSSNLGYNIEEEFAIAIITNGEGYPLNDLTVAILTCYYNEPYDFPDFTDFNVDEAILQGYTGTYASAEFPLKISIIYEHGEFLAQATGQSAFPLTATSETVFKFDPANIQLTFKGNTLVLEQAGFTAEFTKE